MCPHYRTHLRAQLRGNAGSNKHHQKTMGLAITVYYPFHPLQGRTLQVLNKAEKTVTVLDAIEQGLKVPVWMTDPQASRHIIDEKPEIDVFALLSLSELMQTLL